MADPQVPTVTGCAGGGLKTLFERGKRVSEDSEVGMCFLDVTGLGEPQFVVWEGSEFDEWVDAPGSVLSQDGIICIPAHVIGDALAEKVEQRMPDPNLPRN